MSEQAAWQQRERDLLDATNRYLEEARIARRAASGGFQRRVDPWLLSCFGEAIARDRTERSHRFLEEAIETVQATGTTRSEAHQLVDYVFDRPAGELPQEIGGVMVTLAALCLAHGVDMAEAGEIELARVWTKVEKIRAKQAAKPKHSPLPEHVKKPLPFSHDMRAQAAVLADLPDSVAQEAGEFYESWGAVHKHCKKRDCMAEAWQHVLRPYLIGLRDHYSPQARPEASAPPKTLDEWHEDVGDVVWWALGPDGKWLGEPAYIGSPLDLGRDVRWTVEDQEFTVTLGGWPGYHTHWTPHPPFPPLPSEKEADRG